MPLRELINERDYALGLLALGSLALVVIWEFVRTHKELRRWVQVALVVVVYLMLIISLKGA